MAAVHSTSAPDVKRLYTYMFHKFQYGLQLQYLFQRETTDDSPCSLRLHHNQHQNCHSVIYYVLNCFQALPLH